MGQKWRGQWVRNCKAGQRARNGEPNGPEMARKWPARRANGPEIARKLAAKNPTPIEALEENLTRWDSHSQHFLGMGSPPCELLSGKPDLLWEAGDSL